MKGNKLSWGVEAILFALGEPVPTDKLAQALGCTLEAAEAACRALADMYQQEGRGIRLAQRGHGRRRDCGLPSGEAGPEAVRPFVLSAMLRAPAGLHHPAARNGTILEQ